MRLRPLALLFEGADAGRTRIGPDHASLLAILRHKHVPMRRTAQLTFEGHRSRAVRFQRIGTTQIFVLVDGCLPEGGLLALEFARAVKVERAVVQVDALAGEDVMALQLSGRALLLRTVGEGSDQKKSSQDHACAGCTACQFRGFAQPHGHRPCLLPSWNLTSALRREIERSPSLRAVDARASVRVCYKT